MKRSLAPSVSIIIPVYNADKYIKKCLNSLIKQTLENIEILCIDDGSTDASWSVIQEIAKSDNRIITVQQENAGAAVARNKGLELARGEYVGFVDSDDYVDKTYFEYLYETAKEANADIARAYVVAELDNRVPGDGQYTQEDIDYQTHYYNEVLKDAILENKLNQRHVIWLAIYKRKMLVKNDIIFPAKIRTGQDVLFNIKSGYFANKIVYVDKKRTPYYHRVVREDSLMSEYVYSDRGILSRSYVIQENVRFLNSIPNYDKEVYIAHMLHALGFVLERASYIQNKQVITEVAEILAAAWAKVKYKDEIRHELWAIDERFTNALSNQNELAIFFSDISYSEKAETRISVVIPVYNQEKYLEQCIRSVQAQTIKDIEIICVNDGSTDSSEKIMTNLAHKDKRLKVISKENGGVSTARNVGFDVACGEYIIFLDSDDFFEPKLLEKLYNQLETTNADIVVCNFKSYFESMQKYSEPRIDFKPFRSKIVSYETNPDDIFDGLTLMFWNKMFRTEFLRKTGIRNDESLHRAQDIDFIGRALTSTKNITIVKESLVCYRTDTDESNVRRLYKHPDDVVIALENVQRYLEEKRLYSKIKISFTKIAVDHLLANLYFTETYPIHKKIHSRAKKFLQDIDVKTAQDGGFLSEKSRNEVEALLSSSYEEWLRFRIIDLRDDREAKHISYLLEEYKRKYEEEVQRRESMEQSKLWKAAKPIRKARKMLRRG